MRRCKRNLNVAFSFSNKGSIFFPIPLIGKPTLLLLKYNGNNFRRKRSMVVKVALLVIFFAVTILIGVLYKKKVKTMNDFVLGGRNMGPWITAFAYGTSYFSAVIFVGYAGTFVWRFGISALRVIIDADSTIDNPVIQTGRLMAVFGYTVIYKTFKHINMRAKPLNIAL